MRDLKKILEYKIVCLKWVYKFAFTHFLIKRIYSLTMTTEINEKIS